MNIGEGMRNQDGFFNFKCGHSKNTNGTDTKDSIVLKNQQPSIIYDRYFGQRLNEASHNLQYSKNWHGS